MKAALIDLMVDLLEQALERENNQIIKIVLPLSYKLLEDNKNDVKSKTEKLFKKLYSLPTIGQAVIENCPQPKLQRVSDICLGANQKIPKMNGTGSSGKNSSGYGTGNFGANGNSVQLNSRC